MAKWTAPRKLAKKKIQAAQTAKSKLGMSEVEYRDLIGSFGLKSTTQLNDGQFDELMEHFKSMGFETKSGAAYRKLGNLPTPKERYMGKIDAIRRDLDLPWAYVDAMAQKRYGVERVQWAAAGDLFKIMQMMIIHQRRVWDREDKAGAK